jgi:hypothetical protein
VPHQRSLCCIASRATEPNRQMRTTFPGLLQSSRDFRFREWHPERHGASGFATGLNRCQTLSAHTANRSEHTPLAGNADLNTDITKLGTADICSVWHVVLTAGRNRFFLHPLPMSSVHVCEDRVSFSEPQFLSQRSSRISGGNRSRESCN